ncbi:hypothetical protein GMA19_00268 [Paenibacillus polymyxa E681]|uniref:hypothetical protein n=1 Tax=Paenibacillus polymyxa TaxID=1406 RepID=UPI0001E3173F|nr:hypothetical protein [Paenibacillus polymyxa]ADM68149.1 hypothetical protein PPE_00267 [Paenibacillus polymyxa E681]QNV55146.1 hypothetical protein GE561_00268 [Paenibacillus polymyxa E681]QNV59983.1 hypothetical protein GMA19_00268 [Paenibacillus polymyxa E681]
MNDSDSKAFPSKTAGSVHQSLLAVGTMGEFLILIFTLVYIYANDFYYDHLYELEQKFTVFSFVLYYMCFVTYLIWLVQVHKAIRQKHSDYPIRTVGAIARMIPFINLWGFSNTFTHIYRYFALHPELERKARYIQKMIVPLYFVWFGVGIINRILILHFSHMESMSMLLGAIMQTTRMAFFYCMTRVIHNSLVMLNKKDEEGLH